MKINKAIRSLLNDIRDFKELGMPEKDIRQNLVFILERQYGVSLAHVGPIIEKLLKLHKQGA